jgi:hypothetical protein
MSAGNRGTRWLRPAAMIGCVAVFVAGCGGSAPPGEAVPVLQTRLSAVDRAIADHAYRQARRQIQRLVDTTVAARESGELEPDEAEPILAAAASLTSALPQQQPTKRPAPAPQPTPDIDEGEQTPGPDPAAGLSEKEREKRQKELEKKREELQKKREEEQKKDEGEGSE